MSEVRVINYTLPPQEDVLGAVAEVMKLQTWLQDNHPTLTAQERLWVSAKTMLAQVQGDSRIGVFLTRLA